MSIRMDGWMDKYANVETTKFIRLENENENTNSPTQILIDAKRCLLFCVFQQNHHFASNMSTCIYIHIEMDLIIHPSAEKRFYLIFYVHIADL